MKRLTSLTLFLFLFSLCVFTPKSEGFGLDSLTGGGLLGGGGGGAASGGKSPDDMISEALKELDNAKKLEEQSNDIKREMNKALGNARFMQGATGKSLLQQYKALSSAEQSVEASENKQEELSKLFEFKFQQQATLTDAVKVAAKNINQNQVLAEALKDKTGYFDQLKGDQIKSLENINYSLGITMAAFITAGEKSQEVKQNIDNSMNMFFDKGKTVAVESVKMVVVLGLQIKAMTDLIPQLQSDPLKGIKMIPQVKEIISGAQNIISVLQAYKADYDYIENNSGVITQVGKAVIADIENGKSINETIKTKLVAIGENGAAIDEFIDSQKRTVAATMTQKQKEVTEEGMS